jgi:hypothetical protein
METSRSSTTMISTERHRPGVLAHWRPVMVLLTALSAPLLWLTVISSAPAHGAVPSTTAAHPRRAAASAPPAARDSGHDRQHKEGPVAVVASVVGIMVVVAFIAGLGSISVRRRTRDRPPTGGAQCGPPGRERGLFDEWFRTRR